MKRLASLLGIVCGCASIQPADLGLPPLKSTSVFSGPERVRVEMLELDGRALIKVEGISDPTAGLVLDHRVEVDGSRVRYLTPIDGSDWVTMWKETNAGGVEWQLRNPDDWRNPFRIQLDDAQSKSLNATALLELHKMQRDAGTLAKLAAFDRPKNEAEKTSELAKTAASVSEKCGFPISAEIQWSSITDSVMKEFSISGYCEAGLNAVQRACEAPSVKTRLSATLKKVRCSFADTASLTFFGESFDWVTSTKQTNQDEFARGALRSIALDGATFGDWMNLDQTEVCADAAKKHFVSLAPREDDRAGGLAYGDGKSMTRLPQLQMLGDGWFLDPRQIAKSRNSNFRGYDLRFYGNFEVDDKGVCKATCGERVIPLNRLSTDEKTAFMKAAAFAPRPDVREPYAIARDDKGTYFYVDRGSTPDLEKDFRLYVGKRGQLKRQKMKDIVSDSQGEIFSSTSGQLRLVLGRSEAQWIAGKDKRSLILVPVQENLGVIYNELGVYLGIRLFTPCDDL